MGKPIRRRLGVGLLVLAVVLAGCTGGGNVGGGGGAPQADSAAPGAGAGSFYADGQRIVVREASMRVEVSSFRAAFAGARSIARAHGGFVAGWDHDVERGWHRGTLTIRVPAGNFSAVRDDLAGLGTLEGETVRAEDFTVEYRNREERIADLRAEKRTLERLLNRTDDVGEARRLHDDISELRGRIRELEARQASVERREALSTIRLSLHEPSGKRPPRNYESAFGFDDAFLDAFYGGLRAIKYAIVFFGYAIPVGFAAVLFGGFALVLLRLWERVRSALDRTLPGGGGFLRRIRGRRGDGDGDDPED